MDNRTYDVTSGQAVTTYSQTVLVTGISWGAIIAGVFVAVSVASILNLLGLGLDLIALGSKKNPMYHITLISTIWLVLSSMIAMLAGGWVAGRMSGPQLATEGALHGIVMAGVSIFITFMLVASSIGSMIGVMSTVVAHTVVISEHTQNNMSPVLPTNQDMNQTAADQGMNQSQQDKQTTVIQAQDVSKGLGMLVLIFFASFLLSVIAAAFGGAWGAASDRELFIRKEVRVK